MLEDAYVPRSFADDGRHLVDIESADDAKQDHLGLIRRQACTDQRDGGVGGQHIDCRDRGVVIGGIIAECVRWDGNARPARFSPPRINQTVPRDGEHPRAELALVTAEARKVPSSNEPRVGFDVLRDDRVEPAQEPQETWMEVVPQHRDRPLRAILCSRKYRGELARRHVSR